MGAFESPCPAFKEIKMAKKKTEKKKEKEPERFVKKAILDEQKKKDK